MNSYQKLKQKIKQLEQEKRELYDKILFYVDDPEHADSKAFRAELHHYSLMVKMYPKYSLLSLLEKLDKTKNDNTFNWPVKNPE